MQKVDKILLIMKHLLGFGETSLGLIFDGTYIRHEKSRNNVYQRISYSGQKKTPLCKPFTICTTNGYVVDIAGPYNGTMNDACIMKSILEEPNGLKTLLQPGDICIVDRGFRDVVDFLKEQGYHVLMPALKGKRAQLTVEEANASRFVTKVRWPVEAVHGAIGKKYHLLHNVLDNKLLPLAKTLCRIAGFLNNTFGKRLNSDVELADTIIAFMKERQNQQNTMQELVKHESLNRRRKLFTKLSSTSLMDFPELSETDLKILFTGTYQLSQAVCYLAEIITDNGINFEFLKDRENIIKVRVRSRHINRKTYNCFIEYEPNSNTYKGIRRYVCDCANGNRTVGCCAHVATVIYYLAHARYKSKIIKPAEILTSMFDATGIMSTIEENSDND